MVFRHFLRSVIGSFDLIFEMKSTQKIDYDDKIRSEFSKSVFEKIMKQNDRTFFMVFRDFLQNGHTQPKSDSCTGNYAKIEHTDVIRSELSTSVFEKIIKQNDRLFLWFLAIFSETVLDSSDLVFVAECMKLMRLKKSDLSYLKPFL